MSTPPDQQAPLSERELEILRLVAAGLSNKEIAGQLFLSVNTVKVHLRNIFGKIGVQSRTEATMYAVQQGWVNVPIPSVAPPPAETAGPFLETPPPRPPLPWPKRVALVSIVLLAILGVLLTWPHPISTGSLRAGEFSDLPGGLAAANGASASSWQTRAPMSIARGRLAVAAAQGRLYTIGGLTAVGVTGAVEVYNPQSDTWSACATKPLPVANVAAAVLDTRIYVPGGYTASGAPTPLVEVYDPSRDEWSSNVAPLPTPVFAYALTSYQKKLYLFGGSNGQNYLAASYVYEPEANRWTAIAPMPTPRGFAAAAVVKEAIYVVGGYDGRQDLATCERYWPETGQWDSCAPLAVGRGGLGLTTLADKLYAIGGGWNGYLAFSEKYDPTADTWSIFDTPLSGQWRNLAAATIGSDIYAVGGWNGQTYLSANVLYSPFPVKIFLPFQSGSGD